MLYNTTINKIVKYMSRTFSSCLSLLGNKLGKKIHLGIHSRQNMLKTSVKRIEFLN